MEMEWKRQIVGFTAAEIIAALGCPSTTAYQWLDGKRRPPEWQQPHWLAILRRSKRAPKASTQKKSGPALPE